MINQGMNRAPRQDRGQRRVDAILDAAAALIAEAGADAVTVQAIASRAGSSKGSMYHFFRDRESVLLALVERHVERLGESLASSRAGTPPATAAAAADHFLGSLNAYLRAHSDLSRIMGEPSVAQRLSAQREALLALVEAHAAWTVSGLPGMPAERVPTVAATVTGLLPVLRNPRIAAAAGSADAGRSEGRAVLIAYLERAAARPD